MSDSVLRPDIRAWQESALRNLETTFELPTGGGGGNNGGMDGRIDRLEAEMKEVRANLQTLLVDSAEIKSGLRHMATKADAEGVRTAVTDRLANVEGQTKHMLTFWQFLIVMGGFVALVLRWPELFKLAGMTSGNP